MAGKLFLEKVADDSGYLVYQKYRRNCSISHHFRDKCIFAFFTDIQDGQPKQQENHFRQKLADDSADNLGVKNFVKILHLLMSLDFQLNLVRLQG